MNLDALLEAERLGILPADKAELLAEVRRRKLVGGGAPAVEPNPGVSAEAPPDMVFNPQTGQYTSRELLQNHMLQTENPVTTATGAALAGAGRGATLGGIDEISAGLNAVVPGKGTMAERYTVGREMARAAEGAAQEANPDDFLTGEIAGALSIPLGAPLQSMSAPWRLAGGVGAGAGMGSGYGFLTGEGAEERIDGAGTGAIYGGVAGALASTLGLGAQKVADGAANRRVINATVRSAPSSEDLRRTGSALYDEIDSAGVRIRADRVDDMKRQIANYLRKQGAGYTGAERVMPASRAVLDSVDELGAGANTIPFKELDMYRRFMGNASGANLQNAGDTRAVTGAMTQLDDFVQGLGQADIDAGDVETLTKLLPKARETWAKMSRSQLLDDAIENAADYRTGEASGLRAQFQRIIKNPKLSRGFSDEEIKMMRRVVNGTLPEQIVNYLGSGLGMVGQMGGGVAGGMAIGGIPGAIAGFGLGSLQAGATRRIAESLVRNNAERARALVAAGGPPALPGASPAIQQITETLMRRSGATAPQ